MLTMLLHEPGLICSTDNSLLSGENEAQTEQRFLSLKVEVKVVQKHGRTSSTLSLAILGTSPAAEPSTQYASGQSRSVYPFH